MGIGAGGGPQGELLSAVIDDGNDVWEDMEEDEDKTCEDDADDDYNIVMAPTFMLWVYRETKALA